MIPNSVRQNMCSGKKRYKSIGAAIHAAIGSSKSFARPMRWYKCPICNGYHCTSQVR